MCYIKCFASSLEIRSKNEKERVYHPVIFCEDKNIEIGDLCLSYKGISRVVSSYFGDLCTTYLLENGESTPNPQKIGFLVEKSDFNRISEFQVFWVREETNRLDDKTLIYAEIPNS